ncbi:nucleotidyltransferase family protein [Paenibacillus lutrae]|uniref:nucleotidyltransferase family protein n=1 Tax=Paenibacillus lutrae TaxID=2078573 RepID=UPI00308409FF
MEETVYREQLIEWFLHNEERMEALRVLRNQRLPEAVIAAGFVRNYVWDQLHGYRTATPLNDTDVVYLDLLDVSEQRDRAAEKDLQEQCPKWNWSVKNQARMHLRNQVEPYTSLEDALSRWPETATAVGIRWTEEDRLEIVAPHGLSDLFQLRVKRCPSFETVPITAKEWSKRAG